MDYSVSDSTDITALYGRWALAGRTDDEPERRTADFSTDGTLTYRIDVEQRQIILQLEFDVEGDELVTTDRDSGRAIRAHFRIIAGSRLIMDFGGETFEYVRIGPPGWPM